MGYPHIDPVQKLRDMRTKKTSHYDWTDERNDGQLLETINDFIAHSRRLEKECAKHNLPFIDTSSDFENRLEQAFRQLTA